MKIRKGRRLRIDRVYYRVQRYPSLVLMTFGSTTCCSSLLLSLSPPPSPSLSLSHARARERFRRYTGVATRLILTTPDRGSALLVSSASETHKTGTTRRRVAERGEGFVAPRSERKKRERNEGKGNGEEREGEKRETADLVRTIKEARNNTR